jgi:ATP-dependent protease Clp ATPase subunit
VLFHDDGLRKIAELAALEQTGARGLMTVCERVFRNFKYELPSTNIKHFEVTRELVENPIAALDKIMAEVQKEGRTMLRRLVHEFSERFHDSHKLKLNFTEDAADLLAQQSERDGLPIRDLCATKFKDYQFGLKLISQNTGQTEFIIDAAVVTDPNKTLSEWVVASYRDTINKESSTPPPPPESTPDSQA